jgi:2-methylcitrate dehydratase PrpD
MAKKIALNPDDEMRQLCKMVSGTTFADLPPAVVRHARRSILDNLAATVGGSSMEGIEAIVEVVKDKGGKPESFLPFYGGKLPASEVGLALGPMSRAMDFGDVNMVAGHCGEYVLPALIAAAGLKKQVSGKELITAYVVGCEVLIRIGMYIRPGISMNQGREGGHYIFACVAAVGKLIGLSQETLENAQGIASAMTQPHSILMYNPPTLAIRAHHGFICQDAINACLLAARGITGPRNGVLSSQAGYAGFVNWESDIAAVTKDLGKKWEMTKVTMKAYPIAASALTAIYGMSAQRKEYDFKGDDIDRIELVVDTRLAGRVTKPEAREAQWHPKSVHDCQFSVPYGLATAAYTGDVFLDSYTEEQRSRADVRKLMTRISVQGDSALPTFAARVTTTLKNGEKYSSEYRYPKGHPEHPLDDQDLIEKFNKCARYSAFALSNSARDSVSREVLELEKVEDIVASIIAPLTPS